MGTRAMVAAERAALAEFLKSLSAQEWDGPTLCGEWRVRDVVAHLLYDVTPPTTYARAVWRARGSIDGTNNLLVDAEAETPPAELLVRFESSIGRGPLARAFPSVALADVLVHHQDIRRPLGRMREIPKDRLISAIEHPDPFARPGRFTKGLRFEATDLDWATGTGPVIRGAGEALALAVVGRPVVLDELEGDGVPLLRERMASA